MGIHQPSYSVPTRWRYQIGTSVSAEGKVAISPVHQPRPNYPPNFSLEGCSFATLELRALLFSTNTFSPNTSSLIIPKLLVRFQQKQCHFRDIFVFFDKSL